MEVVGGSIPLATTNFLTDPISSGGDPDLHAQSFRPGPGRAVAQSDRLNVRPRSRIPLLSCALLALAAAARAATVHVDVQGLDDEMRTAVLASLSLDDYAKRDISEAELRAAYRNADAQIRKALEPFGFYDVQVEKDLSGDAAAGWKARFNVAPGKAAIVRSVHVEVR